MGYVSMGWRVEVGGWLIGWAPEGRTWMFAARFSDAWAGCTMSRVWVSKMDAQISRIHVGRGDS